MSLLLNLIAIAVAAQAPLTFRAEISAPGPIVRLADVADLSPLPGPLRDRAAGVEVARLDGSEEVLSTRLMARRARSALPGLTPWLADGADRPVRIVRPGAPAARSTGEASGPLVEPGETMIVRVAVGPVVVEREVRALQPGWPGRRLFVRTAEGEVLPVRLEAAR